MIKYNLKATFPSFIFTGLTIKLMFGSISLASAQTTVALPPPEAKAEVVAPKGPSDAPKIEKPLDGINATLSAGGLFTSGNSRTIAMTANGSMESRFDNNGIGASILGNYGQSAPPGENMRTTAQNIQGRIRYERYISDQASFFMLLTGRHDKFQGLDFRLNVDPGFKYVLLKDHANTFWGEAGYDLQYDIRRDESLVAVDSNKNIIVDSTGQPVLLDKTALIHSARLFFGFRHAFSKEVTLATGLEYLQSFQDIKMFRLNLDALFAAKIGAGFAMGLGFSGRYDNAPLPGKEKLDTSTTISLIYSFSDPDPNKK